MYNKILVPLDGSPLAECVLPHVDAIARGCGVRSVTFLRIVEPLYLAGGDEVSGFSMGLLDKATADRQAAAEKYLKDLVARTNYDGVSVEWQAYIGRPADEIIEFCRKHDIDLIAIATHGRSGVTRWVWGSVADRVLRSACAPVLMVRPKGCAPGY